MLSWKNRRIQIKNHAKISLMGNFLKGIFASILTMVFALFALSFLPMPAVSIAELYSITSLEQLGAILMPENLKVFLSLTAISLLLYLLLTAPLNIGKKRFYLYAIRGEKPKFTTIFTPFMDLKLIFTSCSLAVVSFVYLALLLCLFIAPLYLAYAYLYPLGPLGVIASGSLYVVGILLLFCFLLLCTPFMLAPYVLAANPDYGVFKSIFSARECLKGARVEFLMFDLSFLLWRLFFGLSYIGSFLLEPYITASMAGFYKELKAPKSKEQ